MFLQNLTNCFNKISQKVFIRNLWNMYLYKISEYIFTKSQQNIITSTLQWKSQVSVLVVANFYPRFGFHSSPFVFFVNFFPSVTIKWYFHDPFKSMERTHVPRRPCLTLSVLLSKSHMDCWPYRNWVLTLVAGSKVDFLLQNSID